MPRGVPKNPKPKGPTDVSGKPLPFKLSSFPAPIGAINAKNVAGNFSKQDSQSWWSRRSTDAGWESERKEKRRRLTEPEREVLDEGNANAGNSLSMLLNGTSAQSAQKQENGLVEQPPLIEEIHQPTTEESAAKVIVIHPGSRWLRIGRASDPLPISVRHVIARKRKQQSNPARPSSYDSPPTPIDPSLEPKIDALRAQFRARMRDYKLRQPPNAQAQAVAYNESAEVDTIPELNDPSRIEWTDPAELGHPDFIVGQEALHLADPDKASYDLRWPFIRGNFNTEGYSTAAELLGDIQALWSSVIEKELDIKPSDYHQYGVMLVVPDLADDVYMREITQLLLRTMGFKKLCIQQESLAITFGVGVSSSCVVDIGATKTSIACIDDGTILTDSRMTLSYGGDDITELLAQLLIRAACPYKELNLRRAYDWQMLESLKESICVLSEADVGLNLFNFDVRRPGKPMHKYKIRLFDEVILAPYCLFDPRTVDFDNKCASANRPKLWAPFSSVDGVVDVGKHQATVAMRNSVRNLGSNQALGLPPVQGPSMEQSSRVPSPAPSVGMTEDISRANSPAPQPAPSLLAAPATTTAIQDVKSSEEIILESSKTPLDLAVFESLCASGNEERVKKLAANIFIVGGTARTINMAWGLQSRLSAHLLARFPHMAQPQVTIQPPTRELDHRILAWKGVSVLVRLDISNDMWIRQDDYDLFGLKGVRDRSALV